MDKNEREEEERQEQIRKIDEKIDNLRYERRQIENLNEEEFYIYRQQDNMLGAMYNSTNDNNIRGLIEEIDESEKKLRRESDDAFIELLNKFDKEERDIEEKREELRKENKNKEKNSNKSTKENEKENRWF